MEASTAFPPLAEPEFHVEAMINDNPVYASGTLVMPAPGGVTLAVNTGAESMYPVTLSFLEDKRGDPSVEVSPRGAKGVELIFVNWNAGSIAMKQPLLVGQFKGTELLLSVSVHSIGANPATISRVISYSFLKGAMEPAAQAFG